MILTPDELEQITDYKQPAAQIKWLRLHRWRFEIGASGYPKVDVAEKDRHLVGARTDDVDEEPNLGAFRKFG
jgi:hypothetical protein